jgi:DNA-binding Xre family transcriptional regulator
MITMPIKFLWSEVTRLMDLRGINSRDELAGLADIHRVNLYKISKENVEPSLKTLSKLCSVLRCQPGDLLEFVDDQE